MGKYRRKNARRRIIIIVAAAVLLLGIVFGILALTGVFKSNDSEKLGVCIDSLLGRNEEEHDSGLLLGLQMMPNEQIEQMILDTAEYTIVKAKGGRATLDILAIDMNLVVSEVEDAIKAAGYDEQDFKQAKENTTYFFINAINNNTNNKKLFKVEVEYVNSSSNTYIIESEELYNAFYGGLLDIFSEIIEELES